MIQVADQLGIHVATVSRAVSENGFKPRAGSFPLRRFFSGGTTSAEGEDMSWDAVKEKLKTIIENEDGKIRSTTMRSWRSSRTRASIWPDGPWPNTARF